MFNYPGAKKLQQHFSRQLFSLQRPIYIPNKYVRELIVGMRPSRCYLKIFPNRFKSKLKRKLKSKNNFSQKLLFPHE